MSLLALFCSVDDFWLVFAPRWKQTLPHSEQIKRQRSGQLVESEIMTILIHFPQSPLSRFQGVLHRPYLGPLALGLSWIGQL